MPLSPQQQKTSESLRDRFFALAAQPDEPAAQALRDEVSRLDDAAPEVRIDGLRVSFHPTARHKAVRFFEASRLAPEVRELFARPLPNLPHLAAGFVDPEELSFRTFENIISLDGFFDAVPLDGLGLVDRARFGDKNVYAFALEAPEATKQRLLKLDELGLYVAPLNAGSRGGQRYIFHSAQLAAALTRAVQAGLGKSLLGGFSHVNPVFRCNRFEPGDEKFHRHLDTPYFDAGRKQVSCYTLLVYLTGGTGSPALEVEGAEVLGRVAPFTCVVMDQQYAHEGRPFDDGRKVFLRTELIFDEPKLTHDPAIGEAFAKAVYLTGQSVFAPELERWAEAAYNRVAAAHWKGLEPAPTPEPLLEKDFRGLRFVTNGFDYWFPRGAVDVTEATALALLDFFNCELDGTAFRAACKTKTLAAGRSPHDALAKQKTLDECVVAPLDKALLFPPPEEANGACCPFHTGEFIASRHSEVLELYASAQEFARRRLANAPVMLMGDQVLIDPSRFVVDGDKVHVLSDAALAPVNFAACWNYGGTPANYLGLETTVQALQPLVPPVLFGVEQDCWHLRFDFFRNSWVARPEVVDVPIPSIRDIDPGQAEEEGGEPWMEAAGDLELPDAPRAKANLWWGDDSPLLRELTSYRRG
ncbi:MAG: hypothetical protein ACOZQL_42860 [Myxococcota bacterium]